MQVPRGAGGSRGEGAGAASTAPSRRSTATGCRRASRGGRPPAGPFVDHGQSRPSHDPEPARIQWLSNSSAQQQSIDRRGQIGPPAAGGRPAGRTRPAGRRGRRPEPSGQLRRTQPAREPAPSSRPAARWAKPAPAARAAAQSRGPLGEPSRPAARARRPGAQRPAGRTRRACGQEPGGPRACRSMDEPLAPGHALAGSDPNTLGVLQAAVAELPPQCRAQSPYGWPRVGDDDQSGASTSPVPQLESEHPVRGAPMSSAFISGRATEPSGRGAAASRPMPASSRRGGEAASVRHVAPSGRSTRNRSSSRNWLASRTRSPIRRYFGQIRAEGCAARQLARRRAAPAVPARPGRTASGTCPPRRRPRPGSHPRRAGRHGSRTRRGHGLSRSGGGPPPSALWRLPMP